MTAWLVELDESERETAVRTLRCPICKAKAGRECRYLYGPVPTRYPFSHTGRYLLGVARGLVPPLPGGRRG